MFCAVTVRPDIAFAVAQVSHFNSNPEERHWTAAKRILRYLQETKLEGLSLGYTAEELIGYCDSDYAGNPDNRLSMSGYLFTLFGGTVTWGSRAQKIVALSSTEAEYLGMGEGVKDCLWIRSLLKELQYPQEATAITNDNQSAQKLVENTEFHRRTIHIEVKEHFLREKQGKGYIKVEYIPTEWIRHRRCLYNFHQSVRSQSMPVRSNRRRSLCDRAEANATVVTVQLRQSLPIFFPCNDPDTIRCHVCFIFFLQVIGSPVVADRFPLLVCRTLYSALRIASTSRQTWPPMSAPQFRNSMRVGCSKMS